MLKKINYILLKLFVGIHNYSYKVISILSILRNKGLHPKHKLMNYHKFFVDNIEKNSKVLDVGCGNGALTFDLAQKAEMVVGIDFNKKNIEIAEKKYSAPNIKYLIGNAINYDFNQKFDVVVLSNVLEHIENRIDFLKRIKKLAPKILIRVPMLNRDWITLYKKELGSYWKLDKTHCIEYTLGRLREELKQAGLKITNFSIQFGEIWGIVE